MESEGKKLDEITKNKYQQMISEISIAGYPINNILDIRYSSKDYIEVIPILIKWLPTFYDVDVKEEIVRALAVKFAKPAGLILVEEFKQAALMDNKSYAWAIGNTISFFADDSLFDEISIIVINREYSIARQMLTVALGKMKNPKAKSILINLLLDEDVAGHAIIGLRNMNAIDTKNKIEPFLGHQRTWWRNEAKKTILKFDKELKKKS